jgi:prepilin-type N-terminal cleavage/methylation domain-containing protein
MTNDGKNLARIRPSGLTGSSFGARGGFTLIELLVVIAIIIVLAGLVLSTVGYVQKKGARSRAETEIAAMSAACESYKADNGVYPTSTPTNQLMANSNGDPTRAIYQNASLYLYEELSGDHNADRIVNAADDLSGGGIVPKTYFTFKPNNLLPAPPSASTVISLRDPFGNSYGYSTFESANPGSANGNNPTFDLWSTDGTISAANPPDQSQWIKNW